MYLHHILNQNKESLLLTFFKHQLKTRKPKDWASRVLKDMREFEIELSMDEIKNTSVSVWKERVKLKTLQIALDYLNSNIGSKSRTYSELKMSPYLSPNNEVPIDIAKFIAKVQCYMIENVKMNFQQEHKPNFLCNSCKKSECNQSHLMYCPALLGSNQLITYIPNYKDVFDDNNMEEQCLAIMLSMHKCLKKKLKC